jgi:dethiobiotin synthetase
MKRKRTIFITGTDTSVGKTLLTALLLNHLRGKSVNALAMKPFCSGGTGDVRLLQSLQPGEMKDSEMNPYYFEKPVAPLVESLKNPRKIKLKQVLRAINKVAQKCDLLLVEGSGGLMVPLGEGFDVGDLIAELKCDVVVVCRNKLGTINHTLLTLKALKTLGIAAKKTKVVMMDGGKKDASFESNLSVLDKLAPPISKFAVPFLGKKVMKKKTIEQKSKELAKILEKISRN